MSDNIHESWLDRLLEATNEVQKGRGDAWAYRLSKYVDLSEEMEELARMQAIPTNGKKPIGLFFDRMDLVAEGEWKRNDEPFEDRNVTKWKSLAQSYHYYGVQRNDGGNPGRHDLVETVAAIIRESYLEGPTENDDFGDLKQSIMDWFDYLDKVNC
jgi:hypothetical protein